MRADDLFLTVAVELEALARKEERAQPADGDGPSALREWARQLRTLAAKAEPPASEAGGEQANNHLCEIGLSPSWRECPIHSGEQAGEVPMPEPAGKVWEGGRLLSGYTADQMRAYAESVAAPLEERVLQLLRDLSDTRAAAIEGVQQIYGDAKKLKARAEAAEREPDEARRDAARLDWMAHHGASLRHDNDSSDQGWFLVSPVHTGIASVDNRERFPTARAAIDAAMPTTVAEDVAAMRKIVDNIEGKT